MLSLAVSLLLSCCAICTAAPAHFGIPDAHANEINNLEVEHVSPSELRVRQAQLPGFVLEYAPILWLSKDEKFMPSDIAAQVTHTIPKVNGNPVQGLPPSLGLGNLDQLNKLGGPAVYLTSKEGASAYPAWFNGVTPDASGKTAGIVSSVIVTVVKSATITDAFYFYFHAFNKGNKVVGVEFGNHVGDWEHNMVRFQNGVPTAVFFAQHSRGQSFTYGACEKMGKRPVGYIAEGSHAVYAMGGNHDHTIPGVNLPFGPLLDKTDKGRMWDPTLSAYTYSFDKTSKLFTAYDSSSPVPWLYFNGRWGDDALPKGAKDQYEFFGQKHFSAGPTGPIDKKLDRENMSGINGDNFISPIRTP